LNLFRKDCSSSSEPFTSAILARTWGMVRSPTWQSPRHRAFRRSHHPATKAIFLRAEQHCWFGQYSPTRENVATPSIESSTLLLTFIVTTRVARLNGEPPLRPRCNEKQGICALIPPALRYYVFKAALRTGGGLALLAGKIERSLSIHLWTGKKAVI